MVSPQDARIKVRIDTSGAKRDLQGIERGFDRLRRGAAGAVGSIAKTAGLAAFGGAAAIGAGILAPTVSQAAQTAFAVPSAIGRELARRLGVTETFNRTQAALAARERTIQQLGVAGGQLDFGQIQRINSANLTIENLKADTRTAVEKATDIQVVDPLLDKLEEIAKNIDRGVGILSGFVVFVTGAIRSFLTPERAEKVRDNT